MSKIERIRFWFKTRFKPFIKKNKVAVIISLIAIAALIFFAVRWHMIKKEQEDLQKNVHTESVKNGITGAEVKKELLAYKKGGKKAIIVCDAAQMVYHYEDTFHKGKYSTLILDDKDNIASVETNEGALPLWGVNYCSVLSQKVLRLDEDTVYAPSGFKKNKKKIVENIYTLKKGISIPDDEIFLKKNIVNVSYKKIGVIYYPEKIYIPTKKTSSKTDKNK